MTEPTEDLTRLTVNLCRRAVVALSEARAVTEDTATDTVNRALQIYAAMVRAALDPAYRLDVDLFHDGQVYRFQVDERRPSLWRRMFPKRRSS